jgi:hypothetical protein
MENIAVSTMSLDQMTSLLEEKMIVRVMMIAPSSDGNPRRGCEDPNCPAIKGQEVQILTPDTFAKQPLTYQEMFKIRNKELSNSAHNSPSSSFEDKSFNFRSPVTKDQYSYRKERSTSIFDSGSEASTPGGQKDKRKVSNSMHDQLCDALTNKSPLDRAQSDEIIGFPTVFTSLEGEPNAHTPSGAMEESSSERHLSFDTEVSRYQWMLQKVYKEKKELELLNEQLRTQLAMEKRAHEATKKELLIIQTAHRDGSNPPELDDHL